MKKIFTLFLFASASIILADDIEVSQDTLLQNLNYGESADRIITFTNNTSSDVELTITLVDQTWIPPLGRLSGQDDVRLPDVPSELGFSEDLICGTPDPNPEDLLVTIDQVERWLERQSRNSRSIVNVKIAWHVIHQDNSVGNISDQQIAQQVTWLNNTFADHDFIFTLDIIDRTVNNDWFNDMYDTYDAIAKQALNIDSYHYLNVYTSNIFIDGVAGYAYMPNQWPEGSYMHGIVLDYRTLPYAGGYDGDVATHEVGHYLGLNHTFYNNCTTGNDGVDDTPAHHEDYLWQCNNNLDSCPTLPGNDPVHNYMTYTSNSCQWEFTPGQKDRMHAMVATYRPGLLENSVAPLWMTTENETITIPAIGTLDGYPSALLLTTSEYPTLPQNVNLQKLRTLSEKFPDIPLGYSDHTQGNLASSIAISFGACIFEKHFTIDNSLPGPDHWFSSNPSNLKVWSDSIKTSYQMMGSSEILPTESEIKMKAIARRSIVALDDIDIGETLTENNIGLRRPGTGLPPKMFEKLLGKKADKNYEIGDKIEL